MSKIYSIAKEFSKTPGGRFKKEGRFSGEEFRNTVLGRLFTECKKNNEDLIINLDGGYGYATSFLEEAFGGLARDTNDPAVLDIKIVSDEEPALINKIRDYITKALERF